ncbi:hypothetical protein BFG60_0761 [Microcystis aeruginosa NIES-98]|uniref:Uncharacterized protein n=1 Tax=Microcystis aeruginosa NIES-2521 TaxID=2303983 RepID=A0A5A5S1T1_MICAE|nr:hypothetical protein BFG60_0761 [Microcystis aeruginosa NIES-98]GCA79372.1 hypothetical protein MiTs_01362 [Microcystis aeruginosa NIES-2521]
MASIFISLLLNWEKTLISSWLKRHNFVEISSTDKRQITLFMHKYILL